MNTSENGIPDPGDLSEAEVADRIARCKRRLGSDVLILAHHYQRDSIVAVADQVGDSLRLAQYAATATAPYVVFCGVHFMAETADILTGPDQAVLLPELRAGCSMADMATPDDLDRAWDRLAATVPDRVIPVTYINSAATLKAFVARRGGTVCTSSNARAVLQWAYSRGDKVFFFPDEHLGRITAFELGVPLSDMLVWDRDKDLGGHTPEAVRQAKILLWNGYCVVHQMFDVEDIVQWRRKEPDIRVIVHPECPFELIRAADAHGSTEAIARTIAAAPAGSKWAVGTEINLVSRLAARHPDKLVESLSPHHALCANMYKIKPLSVLRVLERLVEGRTENRITVAKDVAGQARVALHRMLSLS